MAGIIFSSKEHVGLAQAELESFFKEKLFSIAQGIFLTPTVIFEKDISLFGFAKESCNVLDSFSLAILFDGASFDAQKKERLFRSCVKTLNAHAQDNYCVKQKKGDTQSISFLTRDLQKYVAKELSYKVNLSKPKKTFYVLQTKEMLYILELIATNEDSPRQRRAHLQAVSKPIAIHPKIAKAMNLLAQSNSIIDPFCGAGGLLIEAALQGFIAKGSDIRQDMVLATTKNANYFGVDIVVKKEDFFDIKKRLPCIVTDLPYGQNSSLSLDKNFFYKKFFKHA
ncbi:MAG: TRM11 family SAM-dependent methyltransferase, partial [Candidatus Nanoarchaeia archaeon]